MACPILAEMRASFCADENRRLPALPCTSFELDRPTRQPRCHSHGGYSSYAQLLSIEIEHGPCKLKDFEGADEELEAFMETAASLSAPEFKWPDTESELDDFGATCSPWTRLAFQPEPAAFQPEAAEFQFQPGVGNASSDSGVQWKLAAGQGNAEEAGDDAKAEVSANHTSKQLQDLLTVVGAAVDALVALGSVCQTPNMASMTALLSQNLASLGHSPCVASVATSAKAAASPLLPVSETMRRLDPERLTAGTAKSSPLLPARRAFTESSIEQGAPVLLGNRGQALFCKDQRQPVMLDLEKLVREVQETVAPKNPATEQSMAKPTSRSLLDEQPTTLMIQNLPIGVTQNDLLQELDRSGLEGSYDFCYVPRAAGAATGNQGFAFVNFVTAHHACFFTEAWHSTYMQDRGRDGRALKITAANVQGLEANVRKWGDPRAQKNSREHRPFISVSSLPKKLAKTSAERGRRRSLPTTSCQQSSQHGFDQGQAPKPEFPLPGVVSMTM